MSPQTAATTFVLSSVQLLLLWPVNTTVYAQAMTDSVLMQRFRLFAGTVWESTPPLKLFFLTVPTIPLLLPVKVRNFPSF